VNVGIFTDVARNLFSRLLEWVRKCCRVSAIARMWLGFAPVSCGHAWQVPTSESVLCSGNCVQATMYRQLCTGNCVQATLVQTNRQSCVQAMFVWPSGNCFRCCCHQGWLLQNWRCWRCGEYVQQSNDMGGWCQSKHTEEQKRTVMHAAHGHHL
jgi:hypothetical protein